MKQNDTETLRVPVECYSRVVGYLRPVGNWPEHKKNEFYNDRKTYAVAKMLPKEQLERFPDENRSIG